MVPNIAKSEKDLYNLNIEESRVTPKANPEKKERVKKKSRFGYRIRSFEYGLLISQ